MHSNTTKLLAPLRGIREDDERTAIISADGVCTYGDLRRRVTQYSDVLFCVGLRPNDAVVISIEHGPDAVAAIFATLEVGAAFVWLDSSQPATRNRKVVRDCGARYLLTDSSQEGKRLVADLAELNLGLLRIGDSSEAYIERISRDRVAATLPADTATVVYTSGSTGTPKGIVLTRSNIDQLTEWYADQVGLSQGARQFQWAQFTYDAACVEIFSVVRSGAALVMPPSEVKSDVRAVAEWIRRHELTHLVTAPSLYRALADAVDSTGAGALEHMRVLTVSGEELRPALVTKMRAIFPRADIYNMYGQTENILATFHLVTPDDEQSPAVPVGHALPGREVVLRTADGDEVADGELGEVWVRSQFLAPGYLNDPEATASAFFPDPHGEPGFRIYRTGDLARRTANGELVFHRRMDHQIKIRGVRVELGEIEAALLDVAGIVHAGVVEREVDEGRSQLVAYVQLSAGASVSPEQLKATLAQRLPRNMVPARFVVLDEMPLTTSGKIDRKRLPAVVFDAMGPGRVDATVDSATERQLALIWSQVLDVQPQGQDADFFALGGDSLTVPRVRDAVMASFGVDVPLNSFYECPQLHQLAARVDMLIQQATVRLPNN
ncbi:non-ribosomal peptide synthetase [Streptomyces silvisoli]|uniref:Non-ribosomal peptide synthetase n=1 Tax=Streptomyces silvisoli TaxID=3034235 RepID=A0ABT5ZGV6_9ACTN|nr:non-ribosomal peptide synthetase [Streptomyces silvisoli]MDF3289057.1 non-ribosomal peptide synthetase [Streptomyces silvisoli]